MSDREQLSQKVIEQLNKSYEKIPFEGIPTVNNISNNEQFIKKQLCAFCIDMRKSSNLMIEHGQLISGRVHKAFLTIVSDIVLRNGGRIRSFQGDSLLAFWKEENNQINLALKSAMEIKKCLVVDFAEIFSRFGEINFGIGLDVGSVYILRIGETYQADNNDLIFIGQSVNFAVAIANHTKGPFHIRVSNEFYDRLNNNWKYDENNVSFWKTGIIPWNRKKHSVMMTQHIISFQE